MRRITVFTSTRAEYGLLFWLMKDLKSLEGFQLQILAAGTHLSPEFGLTYQQIERDGFKIDEKVEMLLSSNTPIGTAKSVGLGVIGFADSLDRLSPDILVILGDRYEALAAAQAAVFLRIPIAHLHGGETTEGAYDEAFRHAITKLSQLHFTSTEIYRERVIQLGESPDRVFNVGAPGLDHLQRTKLLDRNQLQKELNFNLGTSYFLVTYHPETLSTSSATTLFQELLDALSAFQEFKIIFTYPNADDASRGIIDLLKDFAKKEAERVYLTESLGQVRYLSALKFSRVVIGNSSSGIIEAPSLGVPTVNIGSRQKGRISADSVIHCEANSKDICQAIRTSLTPKYQEGIEFFKNPYDQGDASSKIAAILRSAPLTTVKSFHDLEERGH